MQCNTNQQISICTNCTNVYGTLTGLSNVHKTIQVLKMCHRTPLGSISKVYLLQTLRCWQVAAKWTCYVGFVSACEVWLTQSNVSAVSCRARLNESDTFDRSYNLYIFFYIHSQQRPTKFGEVLLLPRNGSWRTLKTTIDRNANKSKQRQTKSIGYNFGQSGQNG